MSFVFQAEQLLCVFPNAHHLVIAALDRDDGEQQSAEFGEGGELRQIRGYSGGTKLIAVRTRSARVRGDENHVDLAGFGEQNHFLGHGA